MNRVVLAITGASGGAIGLRVLQRLSARPDTAPHLILSPSARRTIAHEVSPDALAGYDTIIHDYHDVGATLASGSFRTAGMIVAPCSMHSLAAIATGMADNLITRAADVHLKERRKVVLVARETPLHLGHLRNMVAVTEMGAMVMPPVPAFYHLPQSVADIVDHLAARAIDLLDLPGPQEARPWTGGA